MPTCSGPPKRGLRVVHQRAVPWVEMVESGSEDGFAVSLSIVDNDHDEVGAGRAAAQPSTRNGRCFPSSNGEGPPPLTAVIDDYEGGCAQECGGAGAGAEEPTDANAEVGADVGPPVHGKLKIT